MVIIIVSGTPGTGKTTIAKKIANLNKGKYIDVTHVITKHKLSEGYDKRSKCKLINIKKLNKILIKYITAANKTKKDLIIDSHLAHYLPPKYVTLCIITKTNLKELQTRLKKRHYNAAKIRENLDAEIFDICYHEAQELGHKIKIINTSKPAALVKM
ncbi:AAA family ATPase [Candidatus Woesearchaeota archaeon]|nr:AAA family ATPase [Candidatus Woesearchaeota archaeon]